MIYSLAEKVKNRLIDLAQSQTVPVYYQRQEIFRIKDHGRLTRYRAKTFEVKEPETLEWISRMGSNETLFDIGANLGIYSLFAASRGTNVIALEPEALNFALLCENTRINGYGQLIRHYPFGLHEDSGIFDLSVSGGEWGGALNTFGTCNEGALSKRDFSSQGSYAISLDDFVDNIGVVPNHLKIDVDGNETQIINGAQRVMSHKSLGSILIELDTKAKESLPLIEKIVSYGFELSSVSRCSLSKDTAFEHIANHIFERSRS